MKRFFAIIVSLIIVVCITLTGCNSEIDRDKELQNVLKSTNAELSNTFAGPECDFALITEYLSSWAKASGTQVRKVTEDYIVLDNPATKGNKKKALTVLQCSVDTEDVVASLDGLATSLTSFLGPLEHGPIRLIVTAHADRNFYGAKAVPAGYLKNAHVINLNSETSEKVYLSSYKCTNAVISGELSKRAPKYAQAYKITMTIPEYTDPFSFDKGNNYPNPIQTIGNLLAGVKSAGKLFEIASFTSKANDGYTPYTATAIVVIDANNVEAFTKRFDKANDSVADKFDNLDGSYIFTMDETDMPKRVLTDLSTDKLISLMYTMKSGVYEQDEDSGRVESASSIQAITMKDGRIDLHVAIKGRNSEMTSHIVDDFHTTCGLCDMDFHCPKANYLWKANNKSKLLGFLRDSEIIDLADDTASLRNGECDFLTAAYPGIADMISYHYKAENDKRILKTITSFIESQVE